MIHFSTNYILPAVLRQCALGALLLCSCFAGVSAAENPDTASLQFRVSKWNVDTAFADNGANIDRMARRIKLYPDSVGRQAAIRVRGAASPEGSVEFNRWLSARRARAIVSALGDRTSRLDTAAVVYEFTGRDWNGLRSLIEADTLVPFRSEALRLVDSIAAGHGGSHPLASLKQLKGGRPYGYMLKHLFPQLRRSTISIDYRLSLLDSRTPALIMQSPCDILTSLAIALPAEECHSPLYLALKTNLLYDAMALPSAGIEYYVGRNWSIMANWTYGWWDNDSRHRYWRAYGGDIGVRRWFGKAAEEKPLTGHHVGAFAGVVTYDFEFGGRGYMGGLPHRTLWDRCNIICGVEYGYSLPIARRLNLDFTIGVGYLGGRVIEYVPRNGHYVWQSVRNLRWFGPTKAEISLVWLIGCGNYNQKKGGSR